MTHILPAQDASAAASPVRPDIRRRRARHSWECGRDLFPSSENTKSVRPAGAFLGLLALQVAPWNWRV